MKKKVLSIILASIFCLCGLGMLAGCGEASNPSGEGTDYLSPVLTAEEERMIKEAYVDFYRDGDPSFDLDSVAIEKCYAIIRGAYVVTWEDAFPCPDGPHRQEVAGLEFKLFGTPQITVYKNQELCFLPESYEKGWLTYEELVTLHSHYKQENSWLYSND